MPVDGHAAASRRRIVIVGGGPCGMGAAWRLEGAIQAGLDVDYVLVEKDATLGGKAASHTTPEGFTFDYGGHILYPHADYAEFAALMWDLVEDWHDSLPVRGVFFDKTLIPYPVQRNIHRLPADKRISALGGLGLARLRQRAGIRRPYDPDENLSDYLRDRFGGGLAKQVLEPLNRKMWTLPPSEMGSYWTSQRSGSKTANVADVSVRQIVSSMVTGKDNLGWDSSSRVRYPRYKGTGSIWSAFSTRIPEAKVRTGRAVTSVDLATRQVLLSDGQALDYDQIISSIPLDILAGLLKQPLAAPVAGLRYANASLVGLGFRGSQPGWLKGVHSFHMPDPAMPCWRVSFPASLSPDAVPEGDAWSVLCEISHNQGAGLDLEATEHDIVRGLRLRGILPEDCAVVSRWHCTLEHGYPVPFLGRDAILGAVQGELRRHGIFSRGRFGGWKYEVSNMDHSFMQGAEAVDCILHGRPERTYVLPELVN